jgi:8-oxo-dGTP pyrophosphatase MutT (NUDIX family)
MKQSPTRVSQAAVVAVKNGRVCLITSSSGKRWLVPKGNLQRGRNLRETAACEAWEEAGLLGTVRPKPLGVYEFVKLGKLHEVVVYRMRVSAAKRDWPEKQKRRRRWLRPGKAAERITHAQLREIVAAAIDGKERAA